jgi:hypothetical protein
LIVSHLALLIVSHLALLILIFQHDFVLSNTVTRPRASRSIDVSFFLFSPDPISAPSSKNQKSRDQM